VRARRDSFPPARINDDRCAAKLARIRVDDEYIVTEGDGKVAGIVESEQSMVELLYAYAAWPEARKG
jgi:hypothetical protein